MCGLENSGGVLLPKICCPTAALAAQREPPHPFSAHPNIANVAGLAECGEPSTFKRIVGGEVGTLGARAVIIPFFARFGIGMGIKK